MPMNTAIHTFRSKPLMPSRSPDDARRINVNLPPNVTYAKGQLLAQVAASANEVQTITITGTPTGGSFVLSGVNPLSGVAFTTAAIAYNAASSAVQTALVAALGTGNVTGGGGALPGTPVTATLAGALVGLPMQPMTATSSLTGGTNPAIAITRSTIGATAGTYTAYPGTAGAKGVLMYDCVTDANGMISYSDTANGDYFGNKELATPMYISGTFLTTDVTGLDSTAITNLGASYITNTEFRFG